MNEMGVNSLSSYTSKWYFKIWAEKHCAKQKWLLRNWSLWLREAFCLLSFQQNGKGILKYAIWHFLSFFLFGWKPKVQFHVILDLPLIQCFLLPNLSLPSGDDSSPDRVCNIFRDSPSPCPRMMTTDHDFHNTETYSLSTPPQREGLTSLKRSLRRCQIGSRRTQFRGVRHILGLTLH